MNTTPWAEKAVCSPDSPLLPPVHYGQPEAESQAMVQEAVLFPLTPSGMIVVEGEERVNFLSGLITHQIRKVTPSNALYAGLLSAQGRFLFDFTIIENHNSFWLLTDASREQALLQRLDMYRLRSKVSLSTASDHTLLAIVGAKADQAVADLFPDLALSDQPGGCVQLASGGLLWRDPRLAPHGWRLLLDGASLDTLAPRLLGRLPLAGTLAWQDYRTLHGLPQAGQEWLPENTLPLEAGFLELNGVDFTKGCYVGQETTTRTHHRGTLRRRLFMLTMAEPLHHAPPQTPLLLANGKEAGVLTTLASHGKSGLGLVRLSDVAQGETLFCQGIAITARKPPWANWQLD